MISNIITKCSLVTTEYEAFGGGACSKLDVQGQRGRRISDVNRQGVGDLEKFTIFMDPICVSSLRNY